MHEKELGKDSKMFTYFNETTHAVTQAIYKASSDLIPLVNSVSLLMVSSCCTTLLCLDLIVPPVQLPPHLLPVPS